ncbi:hypothetical protein BOW50_11785 [Solemya velum gill symbiont]|uniref:hypothetical protein n=1 Tax=Solemya velum gill symbiont TaxID=2340 RepID=UPI000995E50C|nr:hypothetical protein [Solemya velum gill symbiont]OOZ75408.1 hypothetical protein BOW50_11785 [Solemya velum gill symbiont]
MKKSAIFVFIVSMLLTMSGCVQVSDVKESDTGSGDYNWLTASQLKQLFTKRTVTSINSSGTESKTYYHSSKGKVTQLRNGKTRKGFWRVTKKRDGSGRICLKMEGGKEQCRAIAKIGGRYYKFVVKKDGQHKKVVSYKKFESGKKLCSPCLYKKF